MFLPIKRQIVFKYKFKSAYCRHALVRIHFFQNKIVCIIMDYQSATQCSLLPFLILTLRNKGTRHEQNDFYQMSR